LESLKVAIESNAIKLKSKATPINPLATPKKGNYRKYLGINLADSRLRVRVYNGYVCNISDFSKFEYTPKTRKGREGSLSQQKSTMIAKDL